MDGYRQLTLVGVTTRAAAALMGLARATATCKPAVAETVPATRPGLANRLSEAEQERVLAVLTSLEFVDQTLLQVFALLLERGEYLCSV